MKKIEELIALANAGDVDAVEALKEFERVNRIIEFSKRGDPDAVNLMNEIDRFEQVKEQEINSGISKCVSGIAGVCADPDAITGRDADLPAKVVELGVKWGELIDPNFANRSN